MIESQTGNIVNFANWTLSAMFNEFAVKQVKFRKVSEESLGRDETPCQTFQELFFKRFRHIYCINELVNVQLRIPLR